MHIVCFQITLIDASSEYRRYHLKRERRMTQTPRIGESVILTPGGWTEIVSDVYYDLENSTVPQVKLGEKVFNMFENEDLLNIARAAGWR
jgi:hypothetical protein